MHPLQTEVWVPENTLIQLSKPFFKELESQKWSASSRTCIDDSIQLLENCGLHNIYLYSHHQRYDYKV